MKRTGFVCLPVCRFERTLSRSHCLKPSSAPHCCSCDPLHSCYHGRWHCSFETSGIRVLTRTGNLLHFQLPVFLINPHFVTTISSLLQVLGILEINKQQFKVFWGKRLNHRSAKSIGFHKIHTCHLLLVFLYLAGWRPDCLESVCIPF